MPGRPGARGPGRVPVGIGPRRCSKGRLGAPPGPAGARRKCSAGRWLLRTHRLAGARSTCGTLTLLDRVVLKLHALCWVAGRDCLSATADAADRQGVPAACRGALVAAGEAAAGRIAGGCGRRPEGDGAGRTGVGPAWPAGAAGRIGVGAVVPAGAAGLAACAGAAGFGAAGGATEIAGPAGVSEDGAAGTAGFTGTTGRAGGAAAGGAATAEDLMSVTAGDGGVGATAVGAGGTTVGLLRAALAAASFACASDLALRFRGRFRIRRALYFLTNFYRDIFRDRTRVRLLFCDAVARQKVDDGLGLYFQLAGQLIYTDLICFAQDFASSGCSESPSAGAGSSCGAA